MTRRTAIGTILLVAACGSEAGAPGTSPAAGGDAPAAPGPAGGSSTEPSAPAEAGSPQPASSACTGKAALKGDLDWTIASGGLDRSVHVHVPPAYDPTKPTPVVLNFHGYTSDGVQQAAYSGMVRKSDEAGFIAVHGDGTGAQKSWNAGACCGDAMTSKVDDVALVRAILDELEAKLCVDTKRVFATGMSNGGFLSHRLACELADRIAAVAPVAGVLGVPACTPSRPVAVMHFHGTLDALVPYGGVDDGTRKFPSVEATSDGWATRNGCTGAPRTTVERDEVTCKTRDKCAGGTEVTLCTITGGGHTWPGAIPIPAFGHTTQAIRATDAMWEFFQKHPKP